jgi:uncharacterized membrane protein YoaK (UPF0700 family)
MASDPSVPKTVPVLLSVLAGYVDSCTFLALFGLFVAQVTGSFVLTGVQLVASERGELIKLLGIPVFFLAGVAATVIVRTLGRRGGPALAAALALETALLAGLLVAWLAGAPLRGLDAPAAVCAALFGLSAMGVQSALVRLVMSGAPSTNVMTSNTTQLAIDATDLLLAWRARRRAPADAAHAAEHARARDRFNRLWPVVLGFLAGTIAGALAYARFDLWCILAAIGLAFALAVWARAIRPSYGRL